MRSRHRASLRALMAATAASAALLIGAAPAWAHVHVEAHDAVPGGYALLTFEVPNESDKGALTSQLKVDLPNVAYAATEVMPGWSARLDRDAAAGTVRSVTWTAAPSTGIAPDQFALFRISVKLPDQQSVTFPATQTYSDGVVVKWDQPPLAGGDEPERPAPSLDLSASQAAGPAPVPTDKTSRSLAIAALALAAAALALAVVRRRQT